MEVGRSFPVVELLENLCHRQVCFERPLHVALPPVFLGLHQLLLELVEAVGGLLVLGLGPFVELVLLHELGAWHDEGRRLFVGEVEEIDVGLHVTLGQQFDSNRLFRHFLFELEVTLVLEVLAAAGGVRGLAGLLGGCLLGVLVEHR